MKQKAIQSTDKSGHLMTLRFESSSKDDLKGVIHNTESVIFKNRAKSPLEELGLVGEMKFRTGLFGVN